jgi:hypothetical protein
MTVPAEGGPAGIDEQGPEVHAEHDLGGVLRNAGRRSGPPEDVAQSVRAAVEAQWRGVIAQRVRRRRIGLSLAATAALAALGLWAARPELLGSGERMAEVRYAVGSVQAKAGALRGWMAVGPGQTLFVGETLATSATGRLALALADGVSVRLDRDTRVTLLSGTRMAIWRGALYVDSGAPTDSRGGPELLVETPAGAVHHLGTQYEARVIGSSEIQIAVRKGKVEIDTSTGAMHRAAAGEQMTVSSAGAVVRSALSPYDEHWQWVAATAPAFSIDGHSVAEFLTWAARELGRDVVYADAATQSEAARVILSGSISGLTPDQALAAVLPTTPLRSQMLNGQLLVSLSEASR